MNKITLDRSLVPEKVEQLRAALLDYDGTPKSEKSIRNRMFTEVLTYSPSEENITRSLKLAMSEITAYSLGASFCLVADCIRAWPIMHPGSASIVLRTLNTEANSYVDGDMGEGVAIGLLEAFADDHNDGALFKSLDCLYGTTVAAAMEAAIMSSSGRSRLSAAVSAFLTQIWNRDHVVGKERLPKVVNFLRTWAAGYVVRPVNLADYDASKRAECSIRVRHFLINEMMVRFFLGASVAGQANMLHPFLDQMRQALNQKS